MNRRTSPGIGQWLSVAVLASTTIFLLFKLSQYATFTGAYPTGLTVAGVDIGGLTREQAREVLTNQYINAPITIFHGEQSFPISPTEAEFQLDFDTMLSQADYERTSQDFWAGFWGFLWGQPIEVNPVPIVATHNREELIDVIGQISAQLDRRAQPPQPVPGTLSFQYGEAGTLTNIEASLDDVENALYRPTVRNAYLVVQPRLPERPEINLLTRLLVNRMQDFESTTGGTGSLYINDLASADEISINGDVPMSGIDLMKVPIVLEVFRTLDRPLTLSQGNLISNTLVIQTENFSANELLNLVAGQDDPYLGAQLVTDSMQRLGLRNTFIVAPYDSEPRPGVVIPQTAVSLDENGEPISYPTNPNPYIQTTAEDVGALMTMIYYCAQGQGGTLMAVYGEQLTQTECATILAYMRENQIGSLIEEGVPLGTAVAHRHGWVSDTHGDAGIVFTPGGDYVIVEILYKPDWLEWELSSPLLADLSRATYNYFNFDNPYLGDSSTN
ncbi:MAG: serine hydrolase [Chloroflexota bacterium]